jgi:hypothetical protein
MKEAWRKWYSDENNKQKHLENLAARRQRRIAQNQSLVTELKRQPCTDCGQTFPPHVMDFDHVGVKTGLISKFVYTVSTARLRAELASCEVVCANCHRDRTQRRRL